MQMAKCVSTFINIDGFIPIYDTIEVEDYGSGLGGCPSPGYLRLAHQLAQLLPVNIDRRVNLGIFNILDLDAL